MLIPQYSLRWLLAITTLVALAFSIAALGLHGVVWAAAVSIAMLASVVLIAVHVALFALVLTVSEVSRRGQPRESSPEKVS